MRRYILKNEKVRYITLLGLLMAILIIATSVAKFAIPKPGIYFNLGEAVIYFVALAYGSKTGAILGGFGSALSDILAGFPVWAPITLVVKGIEAFVVGYVYKKTGKSIISVLCGAIVMLIGYAVSAGLLYGIGAVPLEFAGDIVQVAVGAIIGILLFNRLNKFIKA